MENELLKNDDEINNIFDNIKELVINSRNKVYSVVNTEMLNLYWNIGKAIMEIQQGDERASYGDAVLEKLSQKLTNEFGKGFSARNLRTMRKFYLIYPIWKTVYLKKLLHGEAFDRKGLIYGMGHAVYSLSISNGACQYTPPFASS